MTTATVAPVSGNQLAVLLVLAGLAVLAICAVLYQHERIDDKQGDTIAEHTEQLATLAYQMPALLEWLGIEIPAPEVDDSPAALAGDDAKTDEFPALPATEPSGIPLQVHAALIERPSPVPRRKSAEWVEAEIAAMRARNAERMARAITEEAS